MPQIKQNEILYDILSSKEIYDKLVNEFNITSKTGRIKFEYGGFDIVTNTKDVVGTIIENWVRAWLEHERIYNRKNPNTQTAPDIFLIPNEEKKGWLEVKSFYKTANFDVADFVPFCKNLPDNIWALDEDFLIFQYDILDDGTIKIINVYLKKMWQICGYSDNSSIKVQLKEDTGVHKIRPIAWYSKKADYKPFLTLPKFISALDELYCRVCADKKDIASWKQRIKKSYLKYFGEEISIPDYASLTEGDKSYGFEINKINGVIKSIKQSISANSSIVKSLSKSITKNENLIARSSHKSSSVNEKLKSTLSASKKVNLENQLHEIQEHIKQVEAENEKLISKRKDINDQIDADNLALNNYTAKLDAIRRQRDELAQKLVY